MHVCVGGHNACCTVGWATCTCSSSSLYARVAYCFELLRKPFSPRNVLQHMLATNSIHTTSVLQQRTGQQPPYITAKQAIPAAAAAAQQQQTRTPQVTCVLPLAVRLAPEEHDSMHSSATLPTVLCNPHTAAAAATCCPAVASAGTASMTSACASTTPLTNAGV
jgi:hypothetical protein